MANKIELQDFPNHESFSMRIVIKLDSTEKAIYN